MNDENLAKFKERLEKLKSDILSLIQEEEDTHIVREALDDVDQTSDMLAREMGSKLSSSHKNNLRKVEEALKRIRDHSYGICADCGTNIPIKRLEVLPFAELCIDCQTEYEKYA